MEQNTAARLPTTDEALEEILPSLIAAAEFGYGAGRGRRKRNAVMIAARALFNTRMSTRVIRLVLERVLRHMKRNGFTRPRPPLGKPATPPQVLKVQNPVQPPVAPQPGIEPTGAPGAQPIGQSMQSEDNKTSTATE